jgi:hypothetical protein
MGEASAEVIKLDCHPPRVRLKSGDVVVVHIWLDKPKYGKPFMWRWLGTVVKTIGARGARVIRFGADPGKDEITIGFGSPTEREDEGVWFLPEDQWPDGVHAFRTRLILEGRIDDAVFGG